MAKTNPRLKRLLLEIVDNQLREKTPIETTKTFERLKTEGYTPEEAKDLIACAVTSEIFDIMKQNKTYNEARYIEALKALPKIPGES